MTALERSRGMQSRKRVARGNAGGVEAVIAAAILSTVSLEPITVLSISSGSVAITWTMLFTLIGLANALFGALLRRGSDSFDRNFARVAAALVALLAVPALFGGGGPPGLLAYLNFAVGVAAGVLIGNSWARRNLSRLNVVDAGFFVFVLATVWQLWQGFTQASGLETFHQNAATAWGNSNYVAGVLAVVGILLIARSMLLSRGAWVFYLVATAGFAAALLTLSRGGTAALAAGIATALWFLPKTKVGKVLGRSAAIGAAVAVVYAIDLIEAQRALTNAQVHRNVDTRFILWDAAWKSFLANPISGTGWAGFRGISGSIVETQTFAHNLVLSFLQIGGLLVGVPFLVALVVLAIRAGGHWKASVPVLVAILAISVTDPFVEGTVGGILVWTTLAMGISARPASMRHGLAPS